VYKIQKKKDIQKEMFIDLFEVEVQNKQTKTKQNKTKQNKNNTQKLPMN